MPDSLETNRTIDLLPSEKWDLRVPFIPPLARGTYVSTREMARALLRRPGRYRSPFSWYERVLLRLTSVLPHFDPFFLKDRLPKSPLSFVPSFEWQALARFLVREGVMVSATHWPAPFFHDEPKYGTVRFLLAETKSNPISGTGNSPDFETAFSKAIGETLERFFHLATRVHQPRISRRASVAQLEGKSARFLHPANFTQFSFEQREQYPGLTFDDATVWNWAQGSQVGDRRAILLPAQGVSFGRFGHQNRKEPLLRDRNTNASAGGFTLTEAIVSGVHEAIERDSFLIFWLNALAPPRVDVSTCDNQELHRLISKLKRYQCEAVFLNTTTDVGVPACVCIIVDHGKNGPWIAMGGGCGYDTSQFLLSSLYEALAVRRERGDASPVEDLDQDYQPFQDRALGLERRVRIWRNPTMFPRIEFFLSGPRQSLTEAFPQARQFESPVAELEYLRERLASFGPGYEIYYHEHRHRILDRIGYHVVKVIIPELAHLYLNENRACLGAKRLRTVPPKLGYETAKEWNPWPHPFP